MRDLKELLREKGEIGFILDEDERSDFLRFAKANGFKWLNGKEIKEDDDCFFHVAVSENYTIANISAMCFIKNKRRPAFRMKFKDFAENGSL